MLGLIGLGEMGGPMARNLVRAGYPLCGYDLDAARLAAAAAAGALTAENGAEVVVRAEVVLTSLPSSEAWVRAAEETLLPGARAGQVFIDLGTVTPPQTRRLAAAFAAKGAALLDVPVSGGPGGAERGDLYLFIGGDREVAERFRPLLEVLGKPSRITYCGPSGAGQVAKGVNQLAMGLGAAAYLEAVAFGVRAGLDPTVVGAAVGSDDGWREQVRFTAERAAAGKAEEIGVKFRELPYFLREAVETEFSLPLTQALYHFMEHGERVVIDDHRRAPSFWRELMTCSGDGERESH
jgi:3-hydroxyisobutyrate dehydrogenase-like beta-hydroxyacid dehydrogenase